MNLAERLTLLYKVKQNIKEALIERGAVITETTPLSSYSDIIKKLPSGGDSAKYEAIITALNQTLESIKQSLIAHPYGVLDSTEYAEIPEIISKYIDEQGIKTIIKGYKAIKSNITFDNLESIEIIR